MRFYSTGEAAQKLGVSRDSLFNALRKGAPDAGNRMGGRRVFSETEVEKLAAWYRMREMMRSGIFGRDNGGALDESLV